MATKYSKKYEFLSAIELHCVAKSLDASYNKLLYKTKPETIEKIKISLPDFDKAENSTLYYFEDESGTLKMVRPSADQLGDYPSTTNAHKNAFASSEEHQPVASSGAQSNERILQMQKEIDDLNSIIETNSHKTSASAKSKFGNLKFKITFDESKGVEFFLNSVERYCVANSVTLDQDRITIALNGLSDSDNGAMVCENLTTAEKANWQIFRQKLLNLFGKDASYYNTAYRNFKRQPSESLSLMFSRLIFMFRKAYKSDSELDETDKRIIVGKFIEKCPPRLGQLLEAEEDTLNFDQVSARAQRLESIYNLGDENYSIAAISNGPVKNQGPKSEFSELISEMRSMRESNEKVLRDLTATFSDALKTLKQSSPRKYSQSGTGRSGKPDFSNLKGFCSRNVFHGKCDRSHCDFKHDGIPPEVAKLGKRK